MLDWFPNGRDNLTASGLSLARLGSIWSPDWLVSVLVRRARSGPGLLVSTRQMAPRRCDTQPHGMLRNSLQKSVFSILGRERHLASALQPPSPRPDRRPDLTRKLGPTTTGAPKNAESSGPAQKAPNRLFFPHGGEDHSTRTLPYKRLLAFGDSLPVCSSIHSIQRFITTELLDLCGLGTP